MRVTPHLDSFELGTAISQTVGVSFYVDEVMYISTRRYKLKLDIKIMSGISVSGTSMCVRVSVRVSVCRSDKWLVGPSSTSNRATCFFISLGDTKRCYGVSLCRADASDQRRARCWLPFCAFLAAILWCQRVSTHQIKEHNILARC